MSSKSKKNTKVTKYKKEQINYIEKEKLEKYLSCPICQDILEEPTRITCGHTFCLKCLLNWKKNLIIINVHYAEKIMRLIIQEKIY